MIKITAVYDPKIRNITNIIGKPKVKSRSALRTSLKEIKASIKSELRSPSKSGNIAPKTRYKRFSEFRSARGESLARETGRSEKLISSNLTSSTRGRVGFLTDSQGNNYVAEKEKSRRWNRPTLRLSVNKTLPKISEIFVRRFKI